MWVIRSGFFEPPLRRVGLLGLVAGALAVIWFASPASAAGACMTAPTGGGDWPSYGHDAANTRTQAEASGLGPAAVAGLRPLWAFSTSSAGDETGFNSTPVVYEGCVFVGSSGGVAYALDAKNGPVVLPRAPGAATPAVGAGG